MNFCSDPHSFFHTTFKPVFLSVHDGYIIDIIASGDQIDVNDATIFDREENWVELGVKEAVSVRTKNPSLDCNGDTRITPSHS